MKNFDETTTEMSDWMATQKDRIYWDAAEYLNVSADDIPERAEVKYHADTGIEELYIDGKLVVTIYPMEMTDEHNIKIKYEEHYKEGKHETN